LLLLLRLWALWATRSVRPLVVVDTLEVAQSPELFAQGERALKHAPRFPTQ
jgi:hypothetical protein